MMDFKTILDAVAFDSVLSEALGPFAAVAFVALAATLIGVTVGVTVRGALEQMRGPGGTRALALAQTSDSATHPTTA